MGDRESHFGVSCFLPMTMGGVNKDGVGRAWKGVSGDEKRSKMNSISPFYKEALYWPTWRWLLMGMTNLFGSRHAPSLSDPNTHFGTCFGQPLPPQKEPQDRMLQIFHDNLPSVTATLSETSVTAYAKLLAHCLSSLNTKSSKQNAPGTRKLYELWSFNLFEPDSEQRTREPARSLKVATEKVFR